MGGERLRLGDQFAALSIEGMEIAQHLARIHAAVVQLLFHKRQVVTQESEVEHNHLDYKSLVVSG